MIRERVLAGMSRAAASGTKSGKPIGRPRIEPQKEASIRAALTKGDMGMRKIAVHKREREPMSICEEVQRRNAFAACSAFRLEGLGVSLDRAREIAVRDELDAIERCIEKHKVT
jgi:hypothetical protein